MEVVPFPVASSSSRPSLQDRRADLGRSTLPLLPGVTHVGVPNTYRTWRNSGPPAASGLTPLSPICASPLCTPTPTAPMDDLYRPLVALTNRVNSSTELAPGVSKYLTPPTTPTEDPAEVLTHTLPTWVAVPPTPPISKRQDINSPAPSPLYTHSMPPSISLPFEMQTHEAECTLEETRFIQRDLKYHAALSTSSSVHTVHGSSPTSYTTETSSAPRRRPLFILDGSDIEDEGVEELEPDMQSTHAVQEPQVLDWHLRELLHRDDARRAHALIELLSTEVGYLADLRVLVNIYLCNLTTFERVPTSAFQRSSSFVAATRPNSAGYFPTTSYHCDGIQPLTSVQPKEKEKINSKRVFSEEQLELLARNAHEVLEFHERFVEQLQLLAVQMGVSIPAPGVDLGGVLEDQLGNIDDVIHAVSAKFATESSRFYTYERFCAGHPEALDLIRKTQQQFSSDWSAYEQECSLSITHQQLGLLCTQEESGADPPGSPAHDSSNDHGTSSLSSCQSRRRVRSAPSTEATSARELMSKMRPHRLAFLDYMIKPVQRICKYPMLLQQLKSKGLTAEGSEVDVVVESAAQAMHHVASSVDEARHRQSIAVQSRLISSRIVSGASSGSGKGFFSTDTDAFFTSLGVCLLAGSLDVIHFQLPLSPKSAKYVGAFLYVGGYLILAKVKGKSYEPRHWFSLADFSLVDVTSADEMLPCSFRLSSRYDEFEFAAACQKEKEAWVSAIKESMTFQPKWREVPPPSIQLVDELPRRAPDEMYDVDSPIALSQAIPEPSSPSGDTDNVGAFKQRTKTISRCESSYRPEMPVSRRSSTTESIKNIFTSHSGTDLPTMLISRSSAGARHHVDQGLQDVISEPCLIARSAASRQDGELFSAPRLVNKSGLPRSSSGISITGAMGNAAKRRLSRHESVRVPRRKSTIEVASDPSTAKSAVQVHGPPKGHPRNNRSGMEIERPATPQSSHSLTPSSQPSSATPSTPRSAKESLPTVQNRRLRIQSEKKIYLPRPTTASPYTSSFPSDLSHNHKDLGRKASQVGSSSFFRRFKHRRSRSASEIPTMADTLSPLSPSRSRPLPSLPTPEYPVLPEIPPVGAFGLTISAAETTDHLTLPHEKQYSPSSPSGSLDLAGRNSRGVFRNMNIPLLHRFL